MKWLVRVEPAGRWPQSSWEWYPFGHRMHHGRFGLYLLAVALLLVWHDWADRPWPHERRNECRPFGS